MKNYLYVLVLIILLIVSLLTAFLINSKGNYSNNNYIKEYKIGETNNNEVIDECTDEYEYLNHKDSVYTTAEEEKVSPNCDVILRSFYKRCGHVKKEEIKNIEGIVNKTRDELKEIFPEYEIEKFSANEIVLYTDKDEECGEHYLLEDKEGKVVVYNIVDEKKKEEQIVTDIYTEFLPETDRISIENGIKVYGRDNLNGILEDFDK